MKYFTLFLFHLLKEKITALQVGTFYCSLFTVHCKLPNRLVFAKNYFVSAVFIERNI